MIEEWCVYTEADKLEAELAKRDKENLAEHARLFQSTKIQQLKADYSAVVKSGDDVMAALLEWKTREQNPRK
jgi:nitrate reductase assembly molybdenum cofactor insertion protein NarJ